MKIVHEKYILILVLIILSSATPYEHLILNVHRNENVNFMSHANLFDFGMYCGNKWHAIGGSN